MWFCHWWHLPAVMRVWLEPCFNLFPPQWEHSPAFKEVSPTLRLLTIFKFNDKQPQDESGSPRVSRGEAHVGQGLVGGKDAGVSTYRCLPRLCGKCSCFTLIVMKDGKAAKQSACFKLLNSQGPSRGWNCAVVCEKCSQQCGSSLPFPQRRKALVGCGSEPCSCRADMPCLMPHRWAASPPEEEKQGLGAGWGTTKLPHGAQYKG